MTTYNYTLQTLAPVHIGTGETMTPLEYHLHGQLIVPDLQRVFSRHPDESMRFSQKLTAASPFELATKRLGQLLGRAALEDPSGWRYSMPALYQEETLGRLDTEIGKGNGQILIGTKTVDYRAYVPGSSIKGALKTAWAYAQCIENARPIDEIAGLLARGGPNPERAAREGERALATHIFHSPAQPEDYNNRINRPADAAFDVFRAVLVGDTGSVRTDEAMILVPERLLSVGVPARGGQSRPGSAPRAEFKDYWIFCEAIDAEMSLTGRLQIDDRALGDRSQRMFGWSQAQRSLSGPTLRDAANRFARDLCDWEIEYFTRIPKASPSCDIGDVLDFYHDLKSQIAAAPEGSLFLSIGHGSGWHKMTIGLLLEKKLGKEEFARMRTTLRLDDRHSEFEYPKSRKLVMAGEKQAESPFGWVKVRFTA